MQRIHGSTSPTFFSGYITRENNYFEISLTLVLFVGVKRLEFKTSLVKFYLEKQHKNAKNCGNYT